ncbi:MAG: hypothetical protein GY839_01055 [candidate division Zixibacteria bacterium]|nr:hypothetical protein [candidate division Zixibacteria bacterium]
MRHIKIISFLALTLTLVFCTGVSAQFTAQINPAETVLKGTSHAFANVGLYDDVTTLIGGFRHGIGGYTDAAVRFGFADVDRGGDNGFILGGDLRYQVMEMRIKDPVDLSVGGLVETVLGTGVGNVSLGGFVVGSRNIVLTDSQDLWPYGRLIMRWDHFDSTDEFNIGFSAGAYMDLNESTGVSAEFQFDDQFGFILSAVFDL